MLDKTFAPAEAEARLYKTWEESGAFAADPTSDATPFTVMIPPPNVTGSLHMGHALTFTVQDSLIRYRRMTGRDALWQPGTDHAGIATQMVVERLLATEGKTRKEMGREAFLDRVWQWKGESGGNITRQLRRLGASLDWPRERFTMDAGLTRAVRRIFVMLHAKGLIYRDRRLVNWDPKFQSAISDLEVESKEMDGSLWHLRYPIAGQDGRFITVATTRPETLPGDVAVAVNPEDERYQDLIGKFAILPLVGRLIPIVADEHSDPTKGTGAVKITPAHDFNDFAVGQRHSLPMPSILDRQAAFTLTEIADELRAVPGVAEPSFLQALAGEDRFKLRAAIVAELERLDLLDKVEKHRNQVPHGDRSGVPIEPLLTTQWFCDAATLAKPAVEAVEQGRTVFVPKQWENTFFAWMRDIEPWCISRQLWWGHRIPAWYGPDGVVFVAEDEAGAAAQALAHYGEAQPLAQDDDVLDTWFSSGLWPFSTLGWPDQTPELPRYYPTDVLVTAHDIIFFWVARMMMMGLFAMDDVPFKTIYIHGLVRDERGQKMSKSKGNVIDPLELIDQYGTDALRFTICALTGPGRDVKLGPAVVESYRSFVTKLWNAARFLEMNEVKPVADFDPASVKLPLSRWILDTANTAIAEATTAFESYRLDDYASAGYRFTWNSFCDWFIEFAKPVFAQGDTPEAAEVRAVAAHVLGIILKLLHPAMPYVTEVLWGEFGFGAEGTLIKANWPEAVAVPEAAAARAELDWVVGLITEVRAVRSEMRVAPSVLAPILLKDASAEELGRAARWIDPIRRMGRASEVSPLAGEVPKGSAQAILGSVTIAIPLADLIDLSAERARLEKERAKALDEAQKVRSKLSNESFVARAKPEVVQENRDRLAAFEAEAARLEAALIRLG
ncbi:valine--tRNA ligase [Acidisoma cellulosilytica]|uniref:Valine--tRNA ligase n=1 Tax=Acidisoma cellulosilyticum TaxID=2802395 RepID=A0A964E2P8_9PROT|nr:valine--tRNA ligase [Acidisoma cellulosilyticum]MCB8879467.1 valine--tRNA ligase [Acidisoma cellulosilyticum]